MNAAELKVRMGDLSVRFLQRTASETPLLREWLAKVTADPQTALKELEVIAHRIHGSGAMFGFGAISDAAGAVEKLASDHDAINEMPPAQYVAQMSGLLGALEAALSEAMQSP